MTDLPFMKLYWQDFLADTQHLSLSELGLYVRVLGKMWLSEDATAKREVCVRIAKASQELCPETVFDLLTDDNGRWTQKRLKREWLEAKKRSRSASEAANRRWDNEKNAAASNPHMRIACKPEPEPDISPNGDIRARSASKPRTGRKRKVPLPADFAPSEASRKHYRDRGFGDDAIDRQIAWFADKAAANGYTYVDWQAAFRNSLQWNGPCQLNGHQIDARDPSDRALTFDEQRSYERAFKTPPRTTNKPAGEWAGLGDRPQ